MISWRKSFSFDDDVSRRRIFAIVGIILLTGFAVRIGIRLGFGEASFWTNSYTNFYTAAERLAAGDGFCQATRCSRPPIYVSFLALTVLVAHNYLLVVVPQALIGAGSALCAFLIGRHIFNSTVGVLACAMTALYPYYIVHDTALQDTGMAAFSLALSVWLLLRASRTKRRRDWIFAGVALGVAILVRAPNAPLVGAALFWVFVRGSEGAFLDRLRVVAIPALTVLIAVSPWLIYTYRVTGAPVLTTDVGFELWVGNNPDTFSYYPADSIDRSSAYARSKFTPQERAELRQMRGDGVAISHWYGKRAVGYIAAKPAVFLWAGLRKLDAAFSWRLNPYREPLAQAAYAIGYVPVAVLGIVGMIVWRRRAETALVALLFLALMAVAVVFSMQSSHRSVLDIYWIVFAAAVIDWLLRPREAPTVSV